MSAPSAHSLEDTIVGVAAAHLGMPSSAIDPTAPLSRFGLDSLGAIELTAAIEDAVGVEIPPDLVAEYSDVRTLCAALRAGDARPDRDLMRTDAVLPADIRPVRGQTPRVRTRTSLLDATSILLTGATGFVGGALARTLLSRTDATLVCLVRSTRTPAVHRLARLTSTGRLTFVEGDLDKPRVGLSDAAFAELAARVDAICHAGAAVNWVLRYGVLRGPNVLGTRELLRLACLRAVPFHFVSSLSVCYPSSGPREVDERFDPLPHLDGLHFGYAQTKAVAEALVRQAGARGLPVRIYRPSLVSGHSESGSFNTDDLLSRLVAGCIRMGAAPDLDWRLDAVPVDVLADAIVRLSGSAGPAFHIAHPRPRHWRECVLWMRLYGYPIALIPYRAWVDRLDEQTASGPSDHPLAPLRSFFVHRPDGEALTIPELHEETRRPRATGERSSRLFDRGGGAHVPLDACLLHSYFDAFVAAGHVPPPARVVHRRRVKDLDSLAWRKTLVERLVRQREPDAQVVSIAELPSIGDDSIIGELTSWRSRRTAGLFRMRVGLASGRGVRTRELILKVKAPDADAIAVGESLARLVDGRLGRAYSRWADRLGLVGAREREISLYRQTDRRFLHHTPAVWGVSAGADEEDTWAVLLEAVGSVRKNALGTWPAADIGAAIDGLAALHAIWLGRDDELARAPWIGHVRSPGSLIEMEDLWRALAAHAATAFTAWAGGDACAAHDRLIDTLPEWTVLADATPRTLIHHDFNPRNICLRGRGRRLCAFDWELATIGAPQRDLAELLCFTLDARATRSDVDACLERHRRALAREAGRAIDPAAWRAGFRAALYALMLDRLPIYALVHRVKAQPFLPRVVSTWLALYRLYPVATT